ncbi:hypothetical protein Rs2_40948 [Raphanus sativus]|nr:hypothetical protein Rs2_40948 [Raphanus sativus]
MSDDMDALATRIDALPQEMDTIQQQLDFQHKTSPSIDTSTPTSIDNQQATSEIQQQSIDSNNYPSIDDNNPEQYTSIKEDILNTIKTDNQWELEVLKEKLDVFYCSLNNNINWVTKRSELMQQELDLLRNKQQKMSPSIDTDDDTSIDIDTSQHNGWNTEFNYKPKYGARAHDTYKRKK